MRRASILSLCLWMGCPAPTEPPEPEPAARPAAPALRRLTEAQYLASVRALLGDDLALPTALEPDTVAHGLASVGASSSTISALGIERYEDASFLLAEQIVDDEARLAALLPCEPSGAADRDCASAFVEVIGRRAWRRPLSGEEIDALSGIVVEVGGAEGRFAEGVRYGLAALLQSPRFLYRIEQGEAVKLDGFEIASRLAFLLWAEPPDDALLDRAAAGELDTAEGVRQVAAELLDDPRAVAGVRAFADEWLKLSALPEHTKDPTLFDHAHPDLGPSAREETLSVFTTFALGPNDVRDVMTTRLTRIDARLAALYRVPAPEADGFGWTELPDDGTRRGLLGHASVLNLTSHATRTSATLRGQFLRENLLCQSIPEPPADVDTSLPEVDSAAPTLRDRIAIHLESPACAACHAVTDPIGLGLENLDAVGRWRETENDVRIDPSGDLDGQAFADAWALAQALRDHDDLMPCWTDRLYAYGTGHAPAPDEAATVDWLTARLADSDHRWRELLLAFAASEAFRTVGAP